jgi:lysophospholipase L1-like esterase
MNTVLAFGDSLTFGSDPSKPGRHLKQFRWPEVVARLTGADVISEGLRGRTTCYDQPSSPANLNGAALLPSLLHTHSPIDVLAIMLGTNDCYFGFGALKAKMGLLRLMEITAYHPYRIPSHSSPKILLMAPPPMREASDGSVSSEMISQSQGLTQLIRDIATEKNVGFFDAGMVANSSPIDGIHLDAENTNAIGEAVAPLIAEMLG